jgi:hypothetical protein
VVFVSRFAETELVGRTASPYSEDTNDSRNTTNRTNLLP